MGKHRDTLTPDMFAVPMPVTPLPGGLGFNRVLRRLLSDALKESPLSREEVAARMSELTGDSITKHQLDSWTAESREGWRFPLEYLPAFEVSTETTKLLGWVADVRGGRVLVGKEAIDAEVGRLERQREEAARRIKQLKQMGAK